MMIRILLIALITSTLVVKTYSQTKNFIDQAYIETIAKVDTLVTPDRIYLKIAITEKDTKGKISVEELEAKMESTIQSLGIDTKKNLTLSDLASNYERYFLKRQDILKVKLYMLMVENAITCGKVIVAFEKIELSNVAIERIEYSGIEKLRMELKTNAILKAKKQAEYMTKPLNQKVGSAIFISDISENFSEYSNQEDNREYEIRSIKYSSKTKIVPADIQFDKIKVESGVFVRFKIE